MALRRPSGDPLIAPESWRRPAWGARRRPARRRPPGGRRGRRPVPPGPGSRAAAGGPAGTRSARAAARGAGGLWPGGCEHGRSAAGGRARPGPAPPVRPLPAGGQMASAITSRRRRWVHTTHSRCSERTKEWWNAASPATIAADEDSRPYGGLRSRSATGRRQGPSHERLRHRGQSRAPGRAGRRARQAGVQRLAGPPAAAQAGRWWPGIAPARGCGSRSPCA